MLCVVQGAPRQASKMALRSCRRAQLDIDRCQVSLVGLFVTQIAVLALRAQRTNLQTNASLAADLLLLLASIGAVLVSFLDHQRSLRPSTILSLYLSVLIIVNVARARTLWLIGTDNSMPVVMTVNLTFLIISLAAESVERQSSLKSRKRVGAPEQYSGFWNRASFMWLAATFRAGYSKIISIEDVPRLDTQLASHVLGRELRSTWAKCTTVERPLRWIYSLILFR